MSFIENGHQQGLVPQAESVDAHVSWFMKIVIENRGADNEVTGSMSIQAGTNVFDLIVIAHHRKYLLKYGHVIKNQDGKPALFGQYQLFEFDECYVNQDRLKSAPLLAFEIDPRGHAKIGKVFLSFNDQSPQWKDDQRNLKREILFAIHQSIAIER